MNLLNSIAILFVLLTRILTNANSQNIKDSPYVVVIRYDEHYLCVGTLISFRRVLTSLYCFDIDNFDYSYIRVTAGISNLNEAGTDRKAVRIIHPCDANMEEMDIAVIALHKSFGMSSKIDLIPLCETELNPGVQLRVSGWDGTNANNDEQPTASLQSADVEVFPINQCATCYVDILVAKGINFPKAAICLIDLAWERDTCSGDVGAPAVAEGKLYAVLASKIRPLNRLYPTIYTSISNERVQVFIRYAMRKISNKENEN